MTEKTPHTPLEEALLAERGKEGQASELEVEVTPETPFESPQEPGLHEVPPPGPTAEEEISSLKDQLIRQVAETENLRKRTDREREETARYAVTKFARDMLEIADNLERALQACENQKEAFPEDAKSLLEGVTLTHKTLLATFERHHVKKLTPKGEKFDHNYHQAMFEVETNDETPGTVLDVMQPGYILHDRLLRPAMVGVSKKKAGEGTA